MNRPYSFRSSYTLVLIALLSMVSFSAVAAIQFQDVSSSAGISLSSETWGGQWGDINGDHRPDLFINNHRNRPNFYINNGDGTFTDAALQIMDWPAWMDMEFYDLHGGAFGDIDNDGDTDLFIRTGSNVRNLLFINENGVLNERGNTNGIGLSKSGKAVLMLDYNNDGLLDIITGSGNWKGSGNSTFVDANNAIVNTCEHLTNTLIATDYNDDGSIEILCGLEGSFPRQVLNTQTLPFSFLTNQFPTVSLTNNIVAADLDNDLDIDLFLTRGFLRPTEAALVSPVKMEAWLQGSTTKTKGVEFESNGPVTITTDSTFFKQRSNIYLGANNTNPASISGFSGRLTFTLDPLSPDIDGISAIISGDNRIHIGRVNGVWRIEIPMTTNTTRGYITVESSQAISNINMFGTGINDAPIINALLINSPLGFNDKTVLHGIDKPVSCVSPVAADFDNDMDLDLYLACTGSVANYANRLYINNGLGEFTEQFAHGAEGVTGIGLDSKVGTADSALTADYDLDGRVDIALVNGMGLRPLHIGGPHQLIRNTSTDNNNWIQLKPVGTLSNRDAIGARIYATTSDGTVQLRELNQNHQRWGHSDKTIHFGLGQHSLVTINIEWPSGETDTYSNLVANKFYTLTEQGPAEEIIFGGIPSLPVPAANDACGEPVFLDSIPEILILWKDCSSNTWHFRANKNVTDTTRIINGDITSSHQFQNIVNVGIEQNDIVDNTSDVSSIIYTLNLSNQNSDGFNFQVTDDAQTCFTAPPATDILIGPRFNKVTTQSFNLATFESCDSISTPGTPWNETFSDLSDGTLRDMGDTAWTSQRSTGQYGVSNQQFQITDAGTETTWQSSIIDVAGLSEFHINIDLSGITGIDSTSNSADYIQLSYSIDGQPEVIAIEHAAVLSSGNQLQLISDDLTGNTVQVTIRAKVTAATETIKINSVNVLPGSGVVILPVDPISITIIEDINNDGIISSSELIGTIDVSVTLPAGLSIGDTVTVVDGNGNTQTVVLTAANLAGPVTVNFPSPGDGGTIVSNAVITNGSNTPGNAVADIAIIDTNASAPTNVLITEDSNDDAIISASELTGLIDVSITLPAGLVTGDTVTIVDGNGNTQTVVLAAANLSGPVTVNFPSPGDGGTINVSATITDRVNNVSNAVTDSATLDISTMTPTNVTITEDSNDDAIISASELTGPIDVRIALPAGLKTGDTVTIVDGNGNTQTVVLAAANLSGPVTVNFPSPGDGGIVNASATITIGSNNTGGAVTDSATIDTSTATTDDSGSAGGGCALSESTPFIPVEWLLLLTYLCFYGYQRRQKRPQAPPYSRTI